MRFEASDFDPALRTRLLVLQPTPFCNIDCDYCYLPHRDQRHRMSHQTVRLAVERLREDDLLGPELSIVWHAGEPLTLPPAWYETAFSEVSRAIGSRCRVAHCMQTNATLVDARWCEFFNRHGVRLGVSVDGPAVVHDAHRRTRQGTGTHERVALGMRRLRDAGIDFHAIAVVTRESLEHREAFAEFFERSGIRRLGCNYDEAEGPHTRSSLEGREAAHDDFIRWLQQRCEGRIAIRELDMARERVLRNLPDYRWRGHALPDNDQVRPLAIVSVAHDGGWSTFSPELLGHADARFGDFVFGNVATGSYLAAAGGQPLQEAFAAVMQGVRACERTCAYFTHCGGGAPANKLFELGGMEGTETLYCRSMVKRPFDAVLERAESALQGGASPVH